MDNYTIRKGSLDDMTDIFGLFKTQLLREPNGPLVDDALRSYPSAVAFQGQNLVGFAYCGYMAPDLLELMNITIHSDHRSVGLGTQILDFLHDEVVKQYAAIMLTNSLLYSTDGSKKPATNFYLRNGYQLVASTGSTNMFWKLLDK
jgi:ribosomal protein S18 acetylase RimI-like enzyme